MEKFTSQRLYKLNSEYQRSFKVGGIGSIGMATGEERIGAGPEVYATAVIPTGDIDGLRKLTSRNTSVGVSLPLGDAIIRIPHSGTNSAEVQDAHPWRGGGTLPLADVQQVADYFLRVVEVDTGDVMTNLRLQKLVYYAQAWHLAITSQSLFEEEIEAWVHGPVTPSLYFKYRERGGYGLDAPSSWSINLSKQSLDVLSEVWGTYSQYSAKRLEQITHSEDPWINARAGYAPGDRCQVVITKGAMREYYSRLLAEG